MKVDAYEQVREKGSANVLWYGDASELCGNRVRLVRACFGKEDIGRLWQTRVKRLGRDRWSACSCAESQQLCNECV